MVSLLLMFDMHFDEGWCRTLSAAAALDISASWPVACRCIYVVQAFRHAPMGLPGTSQLRREPRSTPRRRWVSVAAPAAMPVDDSDDNIEMTAAIGEKLDKIDEMVAGIRQDLANGKNKDEDDNVGA